MHHYRTTTYPTTAPRRKNQAEPTMKKRENCVFCGTRNELLPTTQLVAVGPDTESKCICRTCLTSISDRTPLQWFRWLRRNDPAHWETLVDNHRLGTSELSNTIRRVRIE